MLKQEPIAYPEKRRSARFMTLTDIFSKNSILRRYYFKTLLVIGIVWTAFDYSRFLTLSYTEKSEQYPFADYNSTVSILRLILGIIAYCSLAYILIFPLKNKLRKYPLWLNFVI